VTRPSVKEAWARLKAARDESDELRRTAAAVARRLADESVQMEAFASLGVVHFDHRRGGDPYPVDKAEPGLRDLWARRLREGDVPVASDRNGGEALCLAVGDGRVIVLPLQ
jgi:hypothetical protein